MFLKFVVIFSKIWIGFAFLIPGQQQSSSRFYSQCLTCTNRAVSSIYLNVFNNNEQATEPMQSLLDYHQGEWKGQATSFSVTPDVAAGIVQRKHSSEYNVAVKFVTTSKNNKELCISETIHWDDTVSFRSLPLSDCDIDVDAVDASYSLDTTTDLSNFPTILSGTDKMSQFIIEHCIATGEDHRMRCFALYGMDESLIRIVITNEERVIHTGTDDQTKQKLLSDSMNDKETGMNGNTFTARDLLEMQNDVNRLVDKIVANMDTGSKSNTTTSSIPATMSMDNNNVQNDDKDDDFASKLGRLGDSVSSTEGIQKLAPHDITLLELSSGVWLGDAIVRDTPNVALSPIERGRGFGVTNKAEDTMSWKSKSTRRFGDWSVGVQKIAWRWMWNFGEEIRQIIDVGKALGSPIEGSITKSLAGNVCLDESLSRRIPKDERMVYIDWSQQDSVGFLIGPCSVQVPRYINFDPSAASTSRTMNKPFFTEFCVYQSTSDDSKKTDNMSSDQVNTDGEGNLPELICSKISRLYNFEGRLKQGCTSFYTFKRFGVDDDDDI